MYWALAMIGVLAAAVYVLVVYRAVPGAASERLGELAPLPDDLGQWQNDSSSPEAEQAARHNETLEVRSWHYPSTGLFSNGKLVKQLRYRNRDTGSIVRTGPDQKLTRLRIKK